MAGKRACNSPLAPAPDGLSEGVAKAPKTRPLAPCMAKVLSLLAFVRERVVCRSFQMVSF
eukprot:7708815-Lingulodinium_polyedra.AAC.1